MKNLEYRAWGSTMKLVLLVFLTTTALLLYGSLSGDNWVAVTIGIVGGWVLKDAATKFSEAYKEKGQ